MPATYGASVADEMIFDRVLDALSSADRDAVDRVLRDGGFRSRISRFDLDAARDDARLAGYKTGFAAAKRELADKPDAA